MIAATIRGTFMLIRAALVAVLVLAVVELVLLGLVTYGGVRAVRRWRRRAA